MIRSFSAVTITALIAVCGGAFAQSTASDPLQRAVDVINADELILIWSQGPDDNTQYCYQKIYDLSLTPSVTIQPKPRQTDQRIAGNKKLAVASGNFLGGTYKHLVAAWAGLNDSIKVIVPAISAGTLSWSTVNRVTLPGPLSRSTQAHSARIRLATGNFLGDRRDEVVLAYHGADTLVHLQLFSFNDGSLMPVARGSIADERLLPSGTSNDNWDIAAGDFDGDGDDEVVLCTIKPATGSNWNMNAKIYDVNSSGNFIAKASRTIFPRPSYSVFNTNVAVAVGDFDGVDISEEVAFAFSFFQGSQTGSDTYVYLLKVKDSLNTIISNNGRRATLDVVGENYQEPMALASGDLNRDGRDDVVLAVGGTFYVYTCNDTLLPALRRQQSVSYPNDDQYFRYANAFLAVNDMDRDRFAEIFIVHNWFTRNPGSTQYFSMNLYHFLDTTFTNLVLYASRTNEEPVTSTGNEGSIRHFAIVMGDFDGDRVRLGNAIHYRKSSFQQPTVILNTPPIHFDVLSDTAFDLSGCYPALGCGFSSTYIQSITTDTTITTEIHNDWGVDASLSAGGNILGVSLQAKLKSTYGEGFGKVQGSGRSMTVTTGRVAAGDDWIFGMVVDYDFYEYPVYDSANAPPRGYVLTIIPSNPRPLWIELKDDNIIGNVYRPNHEVGNVLSYETTNSPDVAQMIYQFSDQTIGSTGSSFVEVIMSTFRENGADTTRDIGLEVGASIGAWGIELEANARYNQSQVSSQKTKVGQSITLRGDFGHLAPQFGTTGTYHVTPYTYWAKNGALVLDYKVPALPTGPNSFWLNRYGSQPDLAFNLPWRLDPEKGFPLPGGDQQYRYRTRDIIISRIDPRDNDTITIGARVRNFSLVPITSDVVVRFYRGDPSAGGPQIGQASIIGGIPARGTRYASIPWTVPPGTPRNTRMYAVIDPDNTIPNEIHENNNRGWTPLSDYAAPTFVGAAKDIPAAFKLYQAYPNPFNPSTTIRYDLPVRAHVSLRIYNILGQEITTLINRLEEPGQKEVRFHGIGLASGVYYYRLQAGEFVSTGKMMLLK